MEENARAFWAGNPGQIQLLQRASFSKEIAGLSLCILTLLPHFSHLNLIPRPSWAQISMASTQLVPIPSPSMVSTQMVASRDASFSKEGHTSISKWTLTGIGYDFDFLNFWNYECKCHTSIIPLSHRDIIWTHTEFYNTKIILQIIQEGGWLHG